MEHLFDSDSNNTKEKKVLGAIGKLLITVTGGVAFGLTLLSAPFVTPALRKFCLPYIPATTDQINNILIALRQCQGSVIDLGSGDGRVVIEVAKRGHIAHGVELNPWLVLLSKWNAWRDGASAATRFYRADLWHVDLSRYDNIIIFGVEQMMPALERKIAAECARPCTVLACRFPLPGVVPLHTVGAGVHTVWLYRIKPPQSNHSNV